MTRRRWILLIVAVVIIAAAVGGSAGKQSAQSTPAVTIKQYTSYDECMADPATFYCEEQP